MEETLNQEVMDEIINNDTDYTDVCDMVFQFQDQEGPLDVLWKLVKSTKLSIKEIKLADITEQYLDYVRALSNIDMESMSWFIREAATLLEIKSKSLLPKQEEEDVEEIDEEELYKRRMEMYRIFKETSAELASLENVNRYYKEPEKNANDYRVILKNMNMQGLVEAFSKLLARIDERERPKILERKISKDRFTVRERIDTLRDRLDKNSIVRFNEMFEGDFTRGEMITTFLAVLELLKMQYAIVEQNSMFGEIHIQKKEGGQIDEGTEIGEYN
ncbi:MAG: segregation/condensation protein A [Clostridia bacterium]|nr:segregation/condensation protein A [Clostridia bacterium]